MKEIQLILRQNGRRLWNKKGFMTMSVLLIAVVVALAVGLTTALDTKMQIAVVGEAPIENLSSEQFDVDQLKEAPPVSDLVRNKYQAVILNQGEGDYVIETFQNKETEQVLKAGMTQSKGDVLTSKERGIGTRILGFLTIFVLLEGVFFMHFFIEDKENGTLQRIATAPIRIFHYCLAQLFYCFLCVYVPTLLILAFLHKIVDINIGFTLWQYSWLLALILLVAACFALFMNICVDQSEQALMLTSSLVLMTSLLSGTFYRVKHEGLMKWLTAIFPQKQYVHLLDNMEQNQITPVWDIAYLLTCSFILFLLGWFIARRKIREGRYS